MRQPIEPGSILPGLVFVFVLLGVVSWALLWVAGWWTLARSYKARGRFAGRRWKMQWATLNGLALHKALSLGVGADAHGLRLDVTYMMIPLAPPLHIPWADVAPAFRHVGWVTGDVVELTFSRAPHVALRIRESLAERIAAEVGPAFDIGGTVPDRPPRPRGPKDGVQASAPSPAPLPAASGRMRCPRCGLEQAQAVECVGCGVVVAKARRSRRALSPDREVRLEYQARLKELTPRAWVTPTLIVANIAVLLAMLFDGVDVLNPDLQSLIRWGANYGPRTLQESWRLWTCTFLHIGIMHLAVNLLVLNGIGPLVERLVGKLSFLVAYFVAGLFGSVASLFWSPFTVSAGASGAIFGLYGVLLGFLSRRRAEIPPEVVKPQRNAAAAFLGFNLLYGLAQPGIDVAAHLGGLAAGIACGLLLAAPLTEEGVAGRELRGLMVAAGAFVVLVGVVRVAPKTPDIHAELERLAPVQARLAGAFDRGMRQWKDGELTDLALAELIEETVLEPWTRERERLEQMRAELPGRQQVRTASLFERMDERPREWEQVASAMRGGQGEEAVADLETRAKLRAIFRRRRE